MEKEGQLVSQSQSNLNKSSSVVSTQLGHCLGGCFPPWIWEGEKHLWGNGGKICPYEQSINKFLVCLLQQMVLYTKGSFQICEIDLTPRNLSGMKRRIQTKNYITQAHDEKQGLPWKSIRYNYKHCNLKKPLSLSESFIWIWEKYDLSLSTWPNSNEWVDGWMKEQVLLN